MSAVLFGSISTLADTSELQRAAFNRAFEAHGLDWQWSREEYLDLLQESGGERRIAAYAEGRGETVDARAVHATKSELFQESLSEGSVSPRPGVVETIRAAKERGVKVGLVTTTSPANVEALVASLAPEVSAADFDVVVDVTKVAQPKPDGAAYTYALETLSEPASSAVAIEDNLGGLASASAAGVRCVAFPNRNTEGHDFKGAERVDHLDPSVLSGLGA